MIEKTDLTETESNSKMAMDSITCLAATNADPFAFGEVKFARQNNFFSLQVKIERIFIYGSHSLKVNGTVIATIEVSPDGVGELCLESHNGESVPNLSKDDVVELFNSVGMLILSGTVTG